MVRLQPWQWGLLALPLSLIIGFVVVARRLFKFNAWGSNWMLGGDWCSPIGGWALGAGLLAPPVGTLSCNWACSEIVQSALAKAQEEFTAEVESWNPSLQVSRRLRGGRHTTLQEQQSYLGVGRFSLNCAKKADPRF